MRIPVDPASGRGDRPDRRHSPDGPGARASSGSAGGVVEVLLRFVQELGGSASGLMEVYAERSRLSMRRAIVRIAITTGIAVCALVAAVSAALAVVRGAYGGVAAAMGGREWFGDLVGGCLVLGFLVGAVALALRASSRRDLRRLEEKYGRITEEPEPPDGGRPAGPAGGVGAVANGRGRAEPR